MDPFRREASVNIRRAPGPEGSLSWPSDRSDSGWGNQRAFAAVGTDGQVQVWGDPASGGQLPDELQELLTRKSDTPWIWTVELASSTAAFAARRANGQVVAWGDPGAGGAIPAELETALSSGVVRLFGLGQDFVALKEDGSVIHWGPASSGESGWGISEPSGLDLDQPYQVVTSFDSLAILQNGRVLGCWGRVAGAQQWEQHADLRSALAHDVLELACNNAGFAARTASGQIITWGVANGIGDASGVSITDRPDIARIDGENYEFHGFDSEGKIYVWGAYEGSPGSTPQYLAGEGPYPWPYFFPGPIKDAERMFYPHGGGIGWSFKDKTTYLYDISGEAVYTGFTSEQGPVLGGNGVAVVTTSGSLETHGFQLKLDHPNSGDYFSPLSKPSDASWQSIRSTESAFAALASNGHIGLWGEPSKGASPASPKVLSELLEHDPTRHLYSNAGAFVALGANGTAISWGETGTGGDRNGAPQIFSGVDHLVSPWENVRIDNLGSGLLSLIANGKTNPPGQNTPLRVLEGDPLSVVISGDPNGDRIDKDGNPDTTGNIYRWERNGQARGSDTQKLASINLDALSEGTWSVSPTYLDLPGFSHTLAPLSVQVQKIDNGQSVVQIWPNTFSGPTDQAFSAGGGKVSELVANLSGDPEGINSIDRVQWYRDGVAVASSGSNVKSILLATEPGNYRFEATTTDNQGYTTTQSSGLIRVDPAGSVPRQSRIALGGLQTIWKLDDDGKVQRFDSTSLRMRAVDQSQSGGLLAISAASDGSAWGLDNNGIPCVYSAASNSFLRQDGHTEGSGREAKPQLNLGRGWRQIVAASGSNTSPALWLLGDTPEAGGGNVAYLPGSLAAGQTLEDLQLIQVREAPALQLMAVGGDQIPWGIDDKGDLYSWDATASRFVLKAAGVGSSIRQLQMADQGQVWALTDTGALQMWNGEVQQFMPVPLDSPFWTRRSQLITPSSEPTWQHIALSQLGSFVGIPRSGVTMPVAGTGLVSFDTSEISRLRSKSENPSQLQLLSGETLQDSGIRQVGQNLAFNLNNQVNVAYTLQASRPGEWEGAAIVPKAQSGAELHLQPGPNRDPDGTRLPVLKLDWKSGVDDKSRQAYSSLGYVSPFGGLVFAPATIQPASITTGIGLAAGSALSGDANTPETIQLTANNKPKAFGFNPDPFSSGLGASYYKEYEKKIGKEKKWEMHNKFLMTLGNPSSIAQGLEPLNVKGFFQYELEFEKKADDNSWWNLGHKDTLKPQWDSETGERKRKEVIKTQDGYGNTWREDTGVSTKQDASKLAFSLSFQGSAEINDWTDTSKWEFSDNISFSSSITFPLYSWGLGLIQLSLTLGMSIDYSSKGFGLSSALPAIHFTDKEGKPANSNTPVKEVRANIDPGFFTDILEHPAAKAITDNAVPPTDAIVDYIIPVVNIFSGKLPASTSLVGGFEGADSLVLSILNKARPALNDASDSSEETSASNSSGPEKPPPEPERKINASPKVSAKLKVDSFLLKIAGSVTVKGKWTYDLIKNSWRAKSDLKLGLTIKYGWLDFQTDYTWPLTDSKASLLGVNGPIPETASAGYAGVLTRNLNDQILSGEVITDSFLIKPLSQLVRADGSAIGIAKRLIQGNTGLFELSWMRGTLQSDGLTIAWDPNSLQAIEGSAGFTSNVSLVELSDGRLAVAGSHIAADDPLLVPLSQLPPGTLYRIASDPAKAGTSTTLNDEIPQLGLPNDRVWAQLGSSLVATGSLRQGWQGDSLVAGASGSRDGSGALYILNGSALSSISDLSSLEANKNHNQGLVILGSHLSGSLSGLGQRVADGGDTNGDGFSEIFASAPHDENGAGLVYMIYGGYSLENLQQTRQGSTTLDDLDGLQENSNTSDLYLQTFRGVSGSAGYGTILAKGHDLNGDHHSDALIGYASDTEFAGTVELWNSRAALKTKAFQGGVFDGPQQAIPYFDRSLIVGDRSSETNQSRFAIHDASSVGDVNGDGFGDVVLCSDGMAAMVFGNALMPVFWEVASILPDLDQNGNLIEGTNATTFTTSWIKGDWQAGEGHRYVLSFSGQDLNGDGKISSAEPGSVNAPELNWVALRVDGLEGENQVALSPWIQDRWQGSDAIHNLSVDFDLTSGSFIGAVRIETNTAISGEAWRFDSDASGIQLDQSSTTLQARLITSNAPGVLNASELGDFDGDGKNDLAFSQAGYRVPNSDGSALEERPGQSAVLFGGDSLAPGRTPVSVEQAGLLIDAGGELTAIGDWNRDGTSDLLIRSPYADNNTGENVLLFGRKASHHQQLKLQQELLEKRAQLLEGDSPNRLAGASAAAGDFAGNGQRELVIGAPNTVSEDDLKRAVSGVRVLTASQQSDGKWSTPTLLPDFDGAATDLQQLSSYTAIGNKVLATWLKADMDDSGQVIDQLWAAFQDTLTNRWGNPQLLHSNPRGNAESGTLGEINALALTDISRDSNGNALLGQDNNPILETTGDVLLVWTAIDPMTDRSFAFQSTYTTANSRWSSAEQQDLQALLLANQDAISGSKLKKLQINPGSEKQSSQIWADNAVASEGDEHIMIKLRRSGDLSQPQSLNYTLRDRSASAGSQYQDSPGSVSFAAGESEKIVPIRLIDNHIMEFRNTNFVVDFSLPEEHASTAQLLLGSIPIATPSGQPILSVTASLQDNDIIRMRAIDAGISLSGPLTSTTGSSGTASTAIPATVPAAETGVQDQHQLANTIALVGDAGANQGLGQVYALFVASSDSNAANPGMDWKELNDIEYLDQPTAAKAGDRRQLNVLIQPDRALATLDPRAGFGTAMAKLHLGGETYFAISAPGNPLKGDKPSRVYVVTAKRIETWAQGGTNEIPNDPNDPLILTDQNCLIIEQPTGGMFGSVLATADLTQSTESSPIGDEELIIGAPGSSQVFIIDGSQIKNKTGRYTHAALNASVLSDSINTATSVGSGFGSAIATLDLDGDKLLDLAVGAPYANPVRAASVFGEGPVVASAGAVHVIKGTNSLAGLSGDIQGKSDVVHFKGHALTNARGDENDPPRPASEGPPPPGSYGFGEELGTALATVDLNSDGIRDLAIGAPQYTPDGTYRTGRVITWLGNEATPWGTTQNLSYKLDASQAISFEGLYAGGRVGVSLAAAGDLQGDQNDDLAIGAPFEDAGDGRVYVAFGSQNRYGRQALEVTGNVFQLDSTNPDSPFQTFEAPAGYQLGQSVVGLGDVNNDGKTGIGGADLFLGSPAAVFSKEATKTNGDLELVPTGLLSMAWGRPWLGANQSLDVPFTQGVGFLLPFGGVPLGLGDLNGDGYSDYTLLGSSSDALEESGQDPAKKTDATKLQIRFGAAVEYEQQQLLLNSFDLKPAGSPLADDQVPLVVAGDFDGDAFGDLVAYTQQGLKQLSGGPNMSVQGDSKTGWNTPGTILSLGGDPISQLASGDFDGDGYDDVVTVRQSLTLASANPVLNIFWGSGAGLQAGGSKTLPTNYWWRNEPGIDGLIALDSNGDGIDELAIYGNDLAKFWSLPQTGWGLQLVTPLRDPSDPFKKAVRALTVDTGLNGVPSALSTGDWNGDGFADLLIDHGGRKIDLLTGSRGYLNPASLAFDREQTPPEGVTLQRTQLARFIGDVNADGRDDLLFSPTTQPDLTDSKSAPKHGPYSFVYLGGGNHTDPQQRVSVPSFSDEQDNSSSTPDRLKSWAQYGYTIESLPGENGAYRTGSIGDINGDGFEEVGFSNNHLYVNGKSEQRPHSILIYGTSRLSADALKSTTTNDGTTFSDTLHQLGSAGKQELLLRGKAGSDLLQVHADPYGATLSIPSSGENAGRLTISSSSGTTLWSQPRNPYELVLRDGKLQIVRTADDVVVYSRGNGDINRVYLASNGWLYLLKAGVNDEQFRNPDGWRDLGTPSQDYLASRKGIVGLTGWFENDVTTLFEVPTQVYDPQLVFCPVTGALRLVNRQAKSKNGDKDRDNWVYDGEVGERSAYVTLYVGDAKSDDRLLPTQVLNVGESLVDERGATITRSSAMMSLDELEISRRDLHTVVGEEPKNSNGDPLYDPTYTAFAIKRSGRSHDRSLSDVLSNNWYHEDLAWNAEKLSQSGPYVVAMDGNGRLTINAQNIDSGQIKPGSELAVLHAGNPDPFLPPIGSEPVLLRPNTPSDQITQSSTSSRSTNNNFIAVLKGGIDDDRLGVDTINRIGVIDGGPGVDTIFFSSTRSDGSGSTLDLVGLGNRFRNIEAIEIPINNTLIIDESSLLNTSLHRLKLESRGNANVAFQVREQYLYIGDQIDAGLAYSVYAKPNANLQLWVQQGKVSLKQDLIEPGVGASLIGEHGAESAALFGGAPIDPEQLAFNSNAVYRWYYNGVLIAGATERSYGDNRLRTLTPGSYVRETDYIDRTGLRKTVASAPIHVSAPHAVGGDLRVLRTVLDPDQTQRLTNLQSGLSPQGDQVQLMFTPDEVGGSLPMQRVDIFSSAVDKSGPSGLVALVKSSLTGAEAVSQAGVYDFTGDGTLDTLTWQPNSLSPAEDALHAALLCGSRADLAVLPNGLLRFVVQDQIGWVRKVDVAALQSVKVSLIAAPPKVSTVLCIALKEGEKITDLSNADRLQRAFTLLSHQDIDKAPLASGADRHRELWLRADQQLMLFELPALTLNDWDGSLSNALQPTQLLPSSGLAGSKLQLGSTSGLRLELETLTTPQDLSSFVARNQTNGPVLDFRGLDNMRLLTNIELSREAIYNSNMGFYAIDELDGSIRDPLSGVLVAPGDTNYAALATANRVQALDGLSSANRSDSSRRIMLTESRLLAPYAVVADQQLGTQTFYAFAAANPDGISHFRSFGNNVIGLEDLLGGGDLDYDDNLVHLSFNVAG